MSGGFGGGGWGSVPWGGTALEFENPPAAFDVFCFFDSPFSMGSIFSDPDVTIIWGFFPPVFVGNSLYVSSGGPFPTDTSALAVTALAPSSRTLEFTITIDYLPLDFSDLVNRHLFVGTTTAASSCAGLFFSAAGIGYVGGVHFVSNIINLDSTFQLIPGSNAYLPVGVPLVVRMAINDVNGSVYLYVTEVSNLSITGHVLRAILPVINADALAFPPTNATYVSACGTATSPTAFALEELCMSSQVLVANLAPIADAGIDRSVELCSIIQLDGSASFDPEGANLLYRWRLIEAPITSIYSIAGADGRSYPINLSGFTNKFYSPTIGALLDPVVVGDVLLIGTEVRSITAVGVEVGGPHIGQYYMQFASTNIPDNLGPNAQFKVLRQRGIYHDDEVVATFLPDVAGFYRFDLIVSDGLLPSNPSIIVVNVLEAVLPRGVVPDVSFIFGLLSDFWSLVEDTERISTMWSGVAQVVSGELFTLWQNDYAKSLRDVQRQFTRKWLHYDLLLPEPIPELTKTRFMSVSIQSPYVNGFYYGSYPSGGGTVTFRMAGRPDPFTISIAPGTIFSNSATLAAEIQQRLRRVDSRFSAYFEQVGSTLFTSIRIIAPFAFEVVASTMPQINGQDFFVVGVKAHHPQGTTGPDNDAAGAGIGIGTNIYRLASRIDRYGVEENDLLCIDGVAYRIASVAGNASGNSDLILKDLLPTSPSKTWQICSYVTSQLLDFWNGLVVSGDVASMELAQADAAMPSSALYYSLFSTNVVGMCEVLPSTLPVNLSELPIDPATSDHSVLLAKVVRRTYIPVSPLVLDVPTLSANIVVDTQAKEEAVLRRNVDYFLEPVRNGHGIRFVVGTPDVWESLTPPDRVWAEFTYLDNRPVIEQNFGIPVEFTLDKLAELSVELDYLSAVRGLWYAYFNGPTLSNLRIGTQILLGLPFAEESGTIEEIRTDFSPTLGRILVRDTANTVLVRTYTYPKILGIEINPATNAKYVVGDTVTQFAPLVEGADIVDYIKDPKWFQGILNQGVFREAEKYFRFLVTVDSAAFNLTALLAVRDFILKVKPTYTYPMIVVESGNDRIDEISVDDVVTQDVTLKLFDTPCGGMFGSSTLFDHYRGDGTIFNQFDTDADPLSPPPTIPTSDSPVLWAFDKEWLCPEDVLVAEVSSKFPIAAPITVGQCFVVGEPYLSVYKFLKAGPFLVPFGYTTIPVDPNDAAAGVVTTAGTLTKVKIRTQGGMDLPTNDVHGTGTITVVSGAQLIDGETFSFMQSAPYGATFEFDDDGIVTPGNIAVPFTAADTVAVVRNSVITAINSNKRLVGDPAAYRVNVVASIGGPTDVLLTTDVLTGVTGLDDPTQFGGVSDTVADAGFFSTFLTSSLPGGNYYILVRVNGVPVNITTGLVQLTDPNGSTEIVLPGFPFGVVPTDVISVHLASPNGNTPPWTFFEATVYHSEEASWYVGQVLPQGTYRTIRALT